MNDQFELVREKLGPRAVLDEPLAKHTLLRVGGPAKIFYQAESSKDLIKAVRTAWEQKLSFLVLGLGANVLISESGFDGLVIKNKTSRISIVGKKGKIKAGRRVDEEVLLEADSGATLVQLCRFTFDEGLAGLEFLYPIPGTVGGAIKINAHGRPDNNEFIGNLVQEVTLLTPTGEVKKVDQKYLDFSYDHTKLVGRGEVVLSVVFRLRLANKEKVWKKALEYSDSRRRSQPYEFPSAGCFFQNISKSETARFGLANQIYSTGILITQAGLAGTQIGGAKISEKHANFFLNVGGAKSDDFIQLINLAKAKVKEKFGVNLKEEVFLVGKF